MNTNIHDRAICDESSRWRARGLASAQPSVSEPTGWAGDSVSTTAAVFWGGEGRGGGPDNVNALTGGPALPPPLNAPGGLAATAASSSQVNLTWSDNATNEEGFELERATNSAFTSGLVTVTLSANTISRTVTGLSAATTYYFRVRATSSAGASEYSGTASVTTSVSPQPPPTGGTPSSPGGGGGGAPSTWFLGAIALTTLLRSENARRMILRGTAPSPSASAFTGGRS